MGFSLLNPDYRLIVRVFGIDIKKQIVELNVSVLAGNTKLVLLTKDINLRYQNVTDGIYGFNEEDLQSIVSEIEDRFAVISGKILKVSGDFVVTNLGNQQIYPGMRALVIAEAYMGKEFEDYTAELIFVEVYEKSSKALITNHDNRVTIKKGDLLRTK